MSNGLLRGLLLAIVMAPAAVAAQPTVGLFPANGAAGVNPDAHLVLTFDKPPMIGDAGLIRIYDSADGGLVDTLDLSIPASPNPTGRSSAVGTSANRAPSDGTYQVDLIGGLDFHFRPIIVHDNVATIYPHHGVLKYGHSYRVTIDPGVLTSASAAAPSSWTFTTKAAPPSPDATKVTVAADGSGDFNTVQGAIDFAPPHPANPLTIFIKDGHYEELVYMSGKSNLILRGQSRDGVVVGYGNNSAFNPPKAGPSRRPAFSIQDSHDIQLSNFTIENEFIGQAEALLISGERNIIDHMTLNGSGDALTLYGSVYMADSRLIGDGDTILGYGPAFFIRSEIDSIGPFTWTRNSEETHGNVFVDCTFIAINKPLPWTTAPSGEGQRVDASFARAPYNGGRYFPYAEMVLIDAKVSGEPPAGWGEVYDPAHVHFWEYNSTDLNGRPVDVSRRSPNSRQLTRPADSETIDNYSRPEFVLGGWKPVVR